MNWRRRVVRSTAIAAASGVEPPPAVLPPPAAPALDGGVPRGTPDIDSISAPRWRPIEQPARIVCITNQKGGVGKTTTAVSVAAALAANRMRVLLVDLDPQGNASTGLDVRAGAGDVSAYDVVVDRRDARDAVVATAVEGLDVIPGSIDLAGAEVELVAQFNRERRLATALEPLRDDYHVMLVDCPPSLGLLTLNALVAADEAVVPLQTEFYALEGLTQLLRTINLVQADLNARIHISGVVLTMFDARTNLSKQVAEEIRKHFGDLAFTTVIPRSVRLSEAPSFGQPITVYDPSSTGARAYDRLAGEMAGRWGLLVPTEHPLDDLLAPPRI